MIAQFNLAVEYEHLNELQDALDSYQQAIIYANQCNDEKIVYFAQEAIDKVQEKLTEQEGNLTRRSVMRDQKAATKYFNDTEHIREVNRR